jgi:methylmalonyl-CoA mutase N-terminal domain/subunit
MDEALGLPTENAARVALRTQQVVAHESGVADIVDPLGGSFAIEQLTTDLERLAFEYIEKIDAMGGMLRAIELGYVQSEIQDAAYDFQRSVETGDAVVVGVNRYHIDEDIEIPILRIDEQLERDQIERVRAVRATRDGEAALQALDAIEQAAGGTQNLVPLILTAVEAYATVGEISNRLRKVWGEYRESVTV